MDQSIKADRAKLSAAEHSDQEDDWLSRRLDAGLFSLHVSRVVNNLVEFDAIDIALTLLRTGMYLVIQCVPETGNADLEQTVDVILAWLVAEDDGAREKIQSVLADRDESFEDIKATLQGDQIPRLYFISCADLSQSN